MHGLKKQFLVFVFFFFLTKRFGGQFTFFWGGGGLKCFSDLSISPDAFSNIKSSSVFSLFLQILKGGRGGVNFWGEGDSGVTYFFRDPGSSPINSTQYRTVNSTLSLAST